MALETSPATVTATTDSSGIKVSPTLAMTTPFVMPPRCLPDDAWIATSAPSQQDKPADKQLTLLTLHPNIQNAPSCLPSGLSHAVYSPAVCPSGWSYFFMAPVTPAVDTSPDMAPGDSTDKPRTNQGYITTAHCCPSGYSMNVQTYAHDEIESRVCHRQVSESETIMALVNADSPNKTAVSSPAVFVYEPIPVTWEAHDAQTMTPSPPQVNPDLFVPTWDGHSHVQRISKRQSQQSGRGLATKVFVAVIVVPVLIFLAILGCCICFFRARRRKEKREIAREREAHQAAAAEASKVSTAGSTTLPATQREGEPRVGETAAAAAAATTAATTATATTATTTTATATATATVETATERTDLTRTSHSSVVPTAQQSVFSNAASSSHATLAYGSVVKPPYPGLPTHGFDGIEEPPPYAETAPTYREARSQPTLSSTSSPSLAVQSPPIPTLSSQSPPGPAFSRSAPSLIVENNAAAPQNEPDNETQPRT